MRSKPISDPATGIAATATSEISPSSMSAIASRSPTHEPGRRPRLGPHQLNGVEVRQTAVRRLAKIKEPDGWWSAPFELGACTRRLAD